VSIDSDQLQLAIEEFVWQQLQQAQAGSDAQKTWFTTFTGVAHSDEALANAKNLLRGELTLDGLTLDPDMRWNLVVLQNQYLYDDYQKSIERELAKDNSDRARNSAISAEAVRPLPEAKTKWLENILKHRDQFKLSQLKAAAYVIFPTEQSEFYQPTFDSIVAAMDSVNASNSPEYVGTYARLFPLNCSEQGIAQLSKILDGKKDLNPLLEKGLKNRRQENQRCVAMSALMTKSNAG
jgi:aminopeptidase N